MWKQVHLLGSNNRILNSIVNAYRMYIGTPVYEQTINPLRLLVSLCEIQSDACVWITTRTRVHTYTYTIMQYHIVSHWGSVESRTGPNPILSSEYYSDVTGEKKKSHTNHSNIGQP